MVLLAGRTHFGYNLSSDSSRPEQTTMTDQYKYFRSTLRGGVLIVEMTEPSLHGDLMEEQLRQDLFQAWQQSGADAVVLDFSQVRYVTSAVLRALILLRREVVSRNGRIALCGIQDEHVLRIFTTTRLITSSGTAPALFQAYADLPTALAELRPGLSEETPSATASNPEAASLENRPLIAPG
jgi:anti-anti-sigma factor